MRAILSVLIACGLHPLDASAEAPGAPPVVLPAPDFGPGNGRAAAGEPAIDLASRKANAIIDDGEWLARLGVSPLGVTDVRPEMPADLGGEPRTRVLSSTDGTMQIGFFGQNIICGIDSRGERVFAFDFREWRELPEGEGQLASDMDLRWADVAGDMLYVSVSHPTYAATTKGKNAYVAALKIPGGEVVWMSEPLVANASNFVLHDGLIVTGYGFTDEDDFVFVLDAGGGTIRQKEPVKSGPEWFAVRDGRLHVRTYDTDYVFDWVAKRRPDAGAH